MQFSILSATEYAEFTAHVPRIFLPQLPEYAQVAHKQHTELEFLGVRDEKGTILGAGLVTYQPWKRFFRRAHMIYGPLLPWENSDVVTAFFEGLLAHLRQKKNVVAVRFNPLLPRAFYQDITSTEENPTAHRIDSLLRGYGAHRLGKEFYEQSDIQIRYIYTKVIEGMSFEEATATLSKSLRRRFHNEGRYGVTVRFLKPEEFDVFVALHESTEERTTMSDMSAHSQSLYRGLMEELGPEKSFLCVAYFSPTRYISQIDEERESLSSRLEELHTRAQTKARTREISQIHERFTTLESQRERACSVLEKFGDDIPFNSAVSFLSGKDLILLLGGMDKRFVEFGRDYPVERAMFKWACDNGVSIYNTFGISGIFDESAPDYPVLKFKRALNGQVEEFVGTYVLPLRSLLAHATGALN